MEHKCGIIGMIGNDIGNLMINGLHNLQHRGYESAGVSYLYNENIITYKNVGLVKDVFKDVMLPSTNLAIGHVRYSTTKKEKGKFIEEAQPFSNETFAIAHNGNIPFIQKVKEKCKIETTNNSDTYILMKYMELMVSKYGNCDDLMKHIIDNFTGAYSLIICVKDGIYGMRDRYGIRPLTIIRNKDNICVTSESIAFENYEIVHDIKPGEIVFINKNKEWQTIYQYREPVYNFCSFEYIYFMHHKSILNGNVIEDVRYKLGYELGLGESDVYMNSIVIPIPNSSIPASNGFANAIKSVNRQYIVKNENAGRTFILPSNEERKKACGEKFIFDQCHNIKNRHVYIIEDSIVRGTTMKHVINKLKEHNPKTINLRITAPPIVSPCHYGIDMAIKDELIINGKNVDDVRDELGVTSLRYIDIEVMEKVFGHQVCKSCFTGKYDDKLFDW